MLRSDAQARVEGWLREERGSIYAMFDRLGLEWTHDDVLTYVEGTPAWQALELQESAGKALGMALAIAALCVEHDRSLRGRSE